MTAPVPARLDVVVPAHDEEDLIGASVGALLAARASLRRAAPHVEVGLVVVLDACSDGSRSVLDALVTDRGRTELAQTDAVGFDAGGFDAGGFDVVEIGAGNVGAARSAGVTAALRRATTLPDHRRWVATTDADSRVDEDWLAVHLDALDTGAHVLLGTVRPDFADLTAPDRARWLETHPPGHLPGNVHGANLGIRLDRYRALGGFAALPEHEDVDLVTRARAARLVVRATLDSPVVTSGRRVGRTPGGYAQFLATTYGPPPRGPLVVITT